MFSARSGIMTRRRSCGRKILSILSEGGASASIIPWRNAPSTEAARTISSTNGGSDALDPRMG